MLRSQLEYRQWHRGSGLPADAHGRIQAWDFGCEHNLLLRPSHHHPMGSESSLWDHCYFCNSALPPDSLALSFQPLPVCISPGVPLNFFPTLLLFSRLLQWQHNYLATRKL